MRHQLDKHPIRSLATLLVAAFCSFMLSGIPQFRDAKHGVNLVIGDVFWFGFLILALLFIVTGAVVLVRTAMSRRVA